MLSASLPSTLSPGAARLEVRHVDGASAVVRCQAASPLRLLVPNPRGLCAWVFSSAFGGGMVAGDRTRLDVRVGPDARCYLGTQASTKIYRSQGGLECGHQTRAEIAGGGLLVLAPDPVQPFANAMYDQRQEFQLDAGASLVLLDWFSSGRVARGERWAFRRLWARNEVFRAGRRMLVDSLRLAAEPPSGSIEARGRGFDCFGSLLVCGPLVTGAATRMTALARACLPRPGAAVAATASPVEGGVWVRFGARNVAAGFSCVGGWLKELGGLLGDDPWARKW